MKGTIDQVEAFFTGVTGVWGRLIVFVGSLLIGHSVGVVVAKTSWDAKTGLTWSRVDSWRVSWPFSLVTALLDGCNEVPGAAYFMVLPIILLLALFRDWNVLRFGLVLAVLQSWHTFLVTGPSLDDMFVGLGSSVAVWHPLFAFLLLWSVGILLITIFSWRRDERENGQEPKIKKAPAPSSDSPRSP